MRQPASAVVDKPSTNCKPWRIVIPVVFLPIDQVAGTPAPVAFFASFLPDGRRRPCWPSAMGYDMTGRFQGPDPQVTMGHRYSIVTYYCLWDSRYS